jgi:hypothetical protein
VNALAGRDTRLPWVALSYFGLAIVLTWPLVLGIASDVPGDLGDSLLNMWILAWGAEQIPRLLTGATTWAAYWNGNIFHPEPYSLALSEHLFAQALQIVPIHAVTGNIILCYNLLFLSTFVLSAVGAYLLARDLTGDWRAGVIAGLVFGFLPYRISQLPHVQVMSSQWMPFALWGVHRFIRARSIAALIGGTIALVLQNWSCGYYVLYFAPFVALFAMVDMWRAGRIADRAAWVGLATAAVATFVATLPFLLPYLEVQRLYAFERPFGEVLAFSANVWSYATAAEAIHLWGSVLRLYPHGEGETFLGTAAVLLTILAVVVATLEARASARQAPATTGWRRWSVLLFELLLLMQGSAWLSTMIGGGFNLRLGPITVRASTPLRLLTQALIALGVLLVLSPRWRHATRRWLANPATGMAALLLLAVWLSLGPAPSAGDSRVSGFGLYGLLYSYVPGFTGVRVPARYAMVAGIFLAITAAYGAAWLGRRSWGTAALVALGLLVVADGAAMPLPMNHTWGTSEATPPARIYPASAAPSVYRELRAMPADTVVTEFPFGDPAWEIRAVYYAGVHGKPVVNGYSGAFPPGYMRRVAQLRRLDADPEGAWSALVGAGTTHVVVHTPAFGNPNIGRGVMVWLQAHGARLVSSYPEGDALFAVPH